MGLPSKHREMATGSKHMKPDLQGASKGHSICSLPLVRFAECGYFALYVLLNMDRSQTYVLWSKLSYWNKAASLLPEPLSFAFE